MTKKIFAMFLVVLMAISVLPVSAFAVSGCPGANQTHSIYNCSDCTYVKDVAPTCGTDGGKLWKCNTCGVEFLQKVQDATGEHEMEAVEAEPATCGKPGHTAGEKCKNCGYLAGVKYTTAPIVKESEEDICTWVITSDSSKVNCDLGGVVTWECSVCGATKEVKISAEGAHTWGNYVETKPASKDLTTGEVTVGEAQHTCTTCGLVETFKVYPTHNCVMVPVAATAAGCETNGNIQHHKCLYCGRLAIDAEDSTANGKLTLKVGTSELEVEAGKWIYNTAVNKSTAGTYAVVMFDKSFNGGLVFEFEFSDHGVAIVLNNKGEMIRAYDGANAGFAIWENGQKTSKTCGTTNYAVLAWNELQYGEILVIFPNNGGGSQTARGYGLNLRYKTNGTKLEGVSAISEFVTIKATGHNYPDNAYNCLYNERYCTVCGKADPSYKQYGQHDLYTDESCETKGTFNCTGNILYCKTCQKWFAYGDIRMVNGEALEGDVAIKDVNDGGTYTGIYVGHKFESYFDCTKGEQECTVCGKTFKYDDLSTLDKKNGYSNGAVGVTEKDHTVTGTFTCKGETQMCTTCGTMVTKDQMKTPSVKNHSFAETFKSLCHEQECSYCKEKFTYETAVASGYFAKYSYTPSEHVWDSGFTCTESTRKCEVCNKAETKALGHLEYTVTVPAACNRYGYSYTICLRPDCKLKSYKDWNSDVKRDDDTTYELLDHNGVLMVWQATKKNIYYFNGAQTSNGYYLNTTTDASEAVHVELEKTTDGYYMTFMSGGSKKYINLVVSGKYVNAKIQDSASSVFQWNKDFGVYTVSTTNGEYFLGNYGENATISACKLDYLRWGQEEYVAFVADGLKLIGESENTLVKVDSEGGLAEHTMVKKDTFDANCAHGGYEAWCCTVCGYQEKRNETAKTECILTQVEKLSDAHAALFQKWLRGVDITTELAKTENKDLNDLIAKINRLQNAQDDDKKLINDNYGEDPYKAPTCVLDGYRYIQCQTCNDVLKVTIKALGHDWKNNDETLNHVNHVGDITKTCQTCGKEEAVSDAHWDGCSKDINNPWADLSAANGGHNNKLAFVAIVRNGSCTAYRVDKYHCSECDVDVYVAVKTEGNRTFGEHKYVAAINGPKTGETINKGNAYKDSTCSEFGYAYYFGCEYCEKVWNYKGEEVEGKIAGTCDIIAKKDHNKVLLETYVKTPCGAPLVKWNGEIYVLVENQQYKCTTCDGKWYDGTEILDQKNDANFCNDANYLVYVCNCGETHIINFVGNFGHYWTVEGQPTAPTHTTKGTHTEKCNLCNAEKTVITAPHAHVNAAGQFFFDCKNSIAANQYDLAANGKIVEDRYCTVCGSEINSVDNNGNKKCNYYHSVHHDATCSEPAYTIYYCTCGEVVVKDTNSLPLGHKAPEVSTTYGKYNDRVYVKDANGTLREYWYYKPATAEEEGEYKCYCETCGKVVTETLAKLEGLNMTVSNKNGDTSGEYTLGSEITVIISADNMNLVASSYSFEFRFDKAKLAITKIENLYADGFELNATDLATANGAGVATIAGSIAGSNDATLAGNKQLVKITLKVLTNVKADTSIRVLNVEAFKGGRDEVVTIPQGILSANLTLRVKGDFSDNGTFGLADLNEAAGMVTGREQYGKLYDVTMDFDNDGEVTLKDLELAYAYYVNK